MDKLTDKSKAKTGRWECHFCHRVYPNTLLYCSACNIARQHTINVERYRKYLAKKRTIKIRK